MSKYALILGGTGGIGTQLCAEFARRGYTTICMAPEPTLWEVEDLKQKYGDDQVIPYALDITDPKQCEKAAEFVKTVTNGGNLDVLYNNAGISYAGPAAEFDNDRMLKLFQVNVFGHFYMTKYMSEYVIKRKGLIVFTSSVAARVPLSWVSLYNATKAAIDLYAGTLHTEMAPFGVRVHSVITGGVDTAICDANVVSSMPHGSRFDVPGMLELMRSSAMMSRRDNVSPEKYAKAVVKQVVSKRDRFNLYHGRLAYILHWLSRFCPYFLLEWGTLFHFDALRVYRAIRARVKNEDKKRA